MTDTPQSPTFTTYREMVDWIADQLRSGGMWGGWTDDGRFTFGDHVVDTEPDADVVHIDPGDDYEVGVMAASIASKMVALASMPSGGPPQPNRAQRRAAAKQPDRNGGGLWTPGR